MWPAVSGAAGYHVYLNDGSGTYRQVGATEGGKSILWSSNGSAFYPSDTEIAGLGKPFTGNPYYRAATPSDGFGSGANSTPTTLQATVTPSPAVSPSPPGIGGIAPDGTSGDYVYAYGDETSTPYWNKIGTGVGGTTLGHNYGAFGPCLSTAFGSPGSAYYLNGYLYSGVITAVTANSATIVGVSASTGATQNFTFTGAAPLWIGSGSAVQYTGAPVLLTCGVDAGGTAHIYSIADTLSTDQTGGVQYNGYRVREYTAAGVFVADHNIPYPSEYLGGAMADGSFIYLITDGLGNSTAPHHQDLDYDLADRQPVADQPGPRPTPSERLLRPDQQLLLAGQRRRQNTIYEYAGSGGGCPHQHRP